MKTSKSSPEKMKSAGSVLMLAVLMVLFGSCQKEQNLVPSNDTSKESGFRFSDNIPPVFLFTTIKIDHRPGRSDSPDYSYTIHADGRIIYEERSRERIDGIREFRLPPGRMALINDVCRQFDFFAIQDFGLYIADAPYTATTYSKISSDKTVEKTLYDFFGRPHELVTFRTMIEDIISMDAPPLEELVNTTSEKEIKVYNN